MGNEEMMISGNTGWNLDFAIEQWLSVPGRSAATQDIPELDAAISSTTGCVRKENQDCAIAARFSDVPGGSPIALFIVCDGIGGAQDGGIIARKTVAILIDSFVRSKDSDIQSRLKEAILMANSAIYSQYRQRGGTTIGVICCANNLSFAYTAGDTRIYELGCNSIFTQVSVDDTVSGGLSQMPEVDITSIHLEQFGNQILQYVGCGPELDLHFHELSTRKETSYLIASDGAYIVGDELAPIFVNAPGPAVAAERVTQLSEWVGGKDNASIICIGQEQLNVDYGVRQSMLEIWSATSCLNVLTNRQPADSGSSSNRDTQKPKNTSTSPVGKATKRGKGRQKKNVPAELEIAVKMNFDDSSGHLQDGSPTEISDPAAGQEISQPRADRDEADIVNEVDKYG